MRALRAPFVSVFVILFACGPDPDVPPSNEPGRSEDDFLEKLVEAEGVLSVVPQSAGDLTGAGYRYYVGTFQQPVDHDNPAGPNFHQRFTVLYRSAEAPVVLVLAGYDIGPGAAGIAEPTAYLEANQILVEHRYFAASTPTSVDWSKLNIRQAAEDQHRIVTALRPLFSGRWLSTGASKGGMTAIYFRMFHPGDVDATLAYVAPNSYGVSDDRYVEFLDNVGTEDCRAATRAVQRALLQRRDELVPMMVQRAEAEDFTFGLLGAERTFEFAVIEAPFGMWQYLHEGGCEAIPSADATTAEELYSYFSLTLGEVHHVFGDAVLTHYSPYWYQSATQLGGPAYPQAHLVDLLPGSVPVRDVPEIYPPSGVAKDFDPTLMSQVQDWVTATGERIMFVYGENDPWTAGAFEENPTRDQVRYTVTGIRGNHGANLTRLTEAQRAEAMTTLRRWLNVPEPPGGLTASEPPFFDEDALLDRRRARLR